MNEVFCDVALPVPLRTTFTYAVPKALRHAVQPGSRVLVPFRKKSLVGVVVDLPERAPENTKIRDIAKVLDALPALTPALLELGHWIAGYYLAPIGEVFRAMSPPITELREQQQIVITEAGRQLLAAKAAKFGAEFEPEDIALLSKLSVQQGSLPAPSSAKLGAASAVLQRLNRRGLIEIRQMLLARKQKTQTILAWQTAIPDASPNRGESPDKKQPRPLQGVALEKHQQHISRVQELLRERGPLPIAQLMKLAYVPRGAIQRMLGERLLDSWEEPIDPAEDPFDIGYAPPAHELNVDQEAALGRVRSRFELGEFGVQLLHGVTGSGKTEVYLRAVQDTLARRKTALILVPEIALTLWIGRQCRAWFGARFEGVAVLHSALTDVERAREWWRVRNGEARVVVGTRSAVFAPLQRLGLIIVDEEQENSYKQEETPRYHGRDVAIVRAKMENAVALLGSATPSLETYHNATAGKYRVADAGVSRGKSRAGQSGNCGFARGVSANTSSQFYFLYPAQWHSGVLKRRNAGAGADQPARLFVVGALPQLRQFRAVRQLQHLHDLSQKQESPGVPLLRFRRISA